MALAAERAASDAADIASASAVFDAPARLRRARQNGRTVPDVVGQDASLRLRRERECVSQLPALFHAVPRVAGPSLLDMMLIEKYGQHRPLNR